MQSILIYIGCVLGAFTLGVVLSTKVKDWFKGVDSDLRSRLKSFESDAVAKTNAEWKKVVDNIVPLPAVAPTPAPAPAPTPVAAEPAPAPVAAAPAVPPVALAA